MNRPTSRSAVEECAQQLRDMIADGELTAGQPLRQDELAARLGISRTPVREAISRLQAEGLAIVERNRGATVFNPTPDELAEIYDVRILLETRAAQLAVSKVTPAVLATLRKLYGRMETEPAWKFHATNSEFHLTLYAAAGHKELYEHIRALRYRSDPYIRILIGGGGGAAAQRGHAALIRAVSLRDEVAAASVTHEHLQETLDTVRSILQTRQVGARSRIAARRRDRKQAVS